MKLLNLFAGRREKAEAPERNERTQKAPYAPQVLSDVYTKSTRARKLQAEGAFSGRSMVEMLGVLAIIGVLSVGAITSYQKAMFKHKLNKYAENVSLMFFNLYDLKKEDNDLSDLSPKLFVPEGLIDHNRLYGNVFYDTFGNVWGCNKHGLYTRLGISRSSSEGFNRSEDAIRNSCPILLQSAKDMNIRKISLSHQKGGLSICNEKCSLTYQDLTVIKIQEICDIIINAPNGDAILYFHM